MNWTKKSTNASIEEFVLKNLGVTSTAEINEQFIKSRNNEYHINGLKDAADIIRNAISFKKQIVICGDYDADGTMATSILLLTFRKLNYDNVSYLIPKRHTEGYGLNMRMIEDIKSAYAGNVCLITVDNGIVAFEPLQKAKEYGWDVIITDHHIGQEENGEIIFPIANVVINPAFLKKSADFSKYCGAGLAYKIAIELLGKEESKVLMPLAMIATFADVVDLNEENYVFARDGLNLLNKGIAPYGLNALVEENDLDLIEDNDILFKLAPQINAPGRLYPDGANKIIELMLCENANAKNLASEIIEANSLRKQLVSEAIDSLDILNITDDVIITYLPNINPGIVGIVAGQITEKKRKPSIVLTDSMADNTLLMGSCRSIEGINIKSLLDKVSEHIEFYGGHEQAAGLSIKKDKLEIFKEAVLDTIKIMNLSFKSCETSHYDFEIKNKDVMRMLKELARFAPYGEGNPKPIFKITDFETVSYCGQTVKELAKEGVKITSHYSSAIAFGLENRKELNNDVRTVNLYGSLSINRFRGKETPQIEFVDFEVVKKGA